MVRNCFDRFFCGGGFLLVYGLIIVVRVGMNVEKSGDVGWIMIVVIIDGRVNVFLKKFMGDEEVNKFDVLRLI